MNRKFKPVASPSTWTEGNQETPIIRIYGGVGKRGVAVAYDEIPALIARLEQLHQQHAATDSDARVASYIDRLFITEEP